MKALTSMEISIILPCFNEAAAVAGVIQQAQHLVTKLAVMGEVLVVDNGSTDQSAAVARHAGARVISEPKRGYGNALRAGFVAARGTYILMADADGTYSLGYFQKMLQLVRAEQALVLGRRIHRDNIPLLHRFLGVPLLTTVLNWLTHQHVTDAHSGMRAFRKKDIEAMKLVSGGMELASEMILKASQLALPIYEVPVPYHPRTGESKLSTWSDGWRHLKFMILYSPLQWFLVPAILMIAIGIGLLLLLLNGPTTIVGVTLYLHPMFLGSLLVVLGYQLAFMGILSQLYGVKTKLILREPQLLTTLRTHFKLEKGLLLGGIISFIGCSGLLYIFFSWWQAEFKNIFEVRLSLFSITLLMVGIQTVFASIVLSIFTIPAED